nr:hypothetical protein [Roseibium aggregatum]
MLELVDRHRATDKPVRLTCVFSEGARIFAFRYSNDGQAPSLYRSDSLDHGGRAVASEPLEGQCARWKPLHENMLLEISADGTIELPLFAEEALADPAPGAAAGPVQERAAAGPA